MNGKHLSLWFLSPFFLLVSLGANILPAQTWNGFENVSTNLQTSTFSFTGSNPVAGDSNENYYDGDMADVDGDGWMDRALISRYGLLLNTGDGLMTPMANTIVGGTYRFGDKDGVGNDATQWADVDNDGDFDILQGGNGETLVLQINANGRFTTKPIPSVSALQIVNTDLEKDGDVDLVIAHAFCSDLLCGHGCPEEGCQGVGNWPKQFNILLNDGNGNFSNVTTARGFTNFGTNLIVGVVSGDVDGDRDFDLMLINGIGRGVTLARNNGSGFFTTNLIPFAVPMAAIRPIGSGFSQGMNLGDIDSDGDLDLVCALDRDTAGAAHPRIAHALFVNDGSGNFVEETASRFTVTGTNFYAGSNGKLMDVDHDGDLDFFAFEFKANKHLQIYLNSGAGQFTYSTNHSRFFPGGSSTGTGADTDVTDLDRDGSYDIWIGGAGQDPRTLLNSHQSLDGFAPNIPRSFKVLSSATSGIVLSWQHPTYADVARRYKVYRSTAPNLPFSDRKVIKQVGNSRHQDEGFAAPLSRFTTTAYLSDPAVTLVGTNSEVQFLDTNTVPGITYYYSISHVGTENIESQPTAEIAVTIPASNGSDTLPPTLEILSPTMQHWSAYARIVLNYADAGTGINPASLRVSMNRALGTGVPPSGRAAGDDLSDIFFRKDGNAYIAALQPPLSLSTNTLATLTASIADNDGNSVTQQVQFFVTTAASQLPTARISANRTNDLVGMNLNFSGSASSDSDGKIVRWEWYFDDGAVEIGRNVTKSFTTAGLHAATLLVRDTHGGVAAVTNTITVSPLRIDSWMLEPVGLKLFFPTITNRSYGVQYTDSLTPTNWVSVGTVSGNGGSQSFTHTNQITSQRFYRLTVQ